MLLTSILGHQLGLIVSVKNTVVAIVSQCTTFHVQFKTAFTHYLSTWYILYTK